MITDGLARQHRQVLGTDVVPVAEHFVELHATVGSNPICNCWCGVRQASRKNRSMLDRELYERHSLVRVRGTCRHAVRPTARPPIAWAATVAGCWTPRRRLASHGLTGTSYQQWADRIEAGLAGRAHRSGGAQGAAGQAQTFGCLR